MITKRPRRLAGISYVGYQRYFVTTCTAFRWPLFQSDATVNRVLAQLRQSCTLFDLAILAYCFMPDHLHLLLVAESERADLPACVRRFKQLTGFAYQKDHARPLWQSGYHDHVLRNADATEAVARYILENPIRAGLALEIGEYPFAGSDVYDSTAILTAWEGWTRRRARQT